MNKVFFIGDLHGSAHPIEEFYEHFKYFAEFDETDVIVCLGDVGLNYYGDKRDRDVKAKLSKLPFTYFCIRGNHEMRVSDVVESNPQQWDRKIFFNGVVWVEKDFPNINYALDTVNLYNIKGYSALVVPGAYSVDKEYRLSRGFKWFENEQLSEEEKEFGLNLVDTINNESGYVDLILSHTSPHQYEAVDLYLPFVDQSKVDKGMEFYLDEIIFKLNFKVYLFGHFHSYREYKSNFDPSVARPYYENKNRVVMLNNRYWVELKNIMEERVIGTLPIPL